jgi:hypothetical protein
MVPFAMIVQTHGERGWLADDRFQVVAHETDPFLLGRV